MEGERTGASAFGALLRRRRIAAGLSQEALAERAGVSTNGIGALERGDRRTPQRETLNALADALRLDPAERAEFESTAGRASRGPASGARGRPLPLPLTSFVSREDELSDLLRLARDHRLVTVAGPGGIGKTRIAFAVAAALSDGLARETWLAELAPVADPSLVPAAVARALGAREVAGRPIVETLVSYAGDSTALLLLDNCEHVIAAAAALVEMLLRACPNLHVLATSREPLRIAGERVYRLPPLGDAAVALFVERANEAGYAIPAGAAAAADVAAICRRLEGIPLAIELAAARTPALGTGALREQLERRADLLAGGSRTAEPRQQTMHAAIAWSYELLEPLARRTFERLSAFAGGWSLDAASALCAGLGEPLENGSAHASLVEKSLIVADFEQSEPRYRMLEPFRDFARERLRESRDAEATLERHAAVVLERAERYDRECDGADFARRRDVARAELDNWRAALEWTLGAGHDAPLGRRLVAALAAVWPWIPAEGSRWISVARGGVDPASPLGVALDLASLNLAGAKATGTDPLQEARDLLERCSQLGDATGTARASLRAGRLALWSGHAEDALPLLERAAAGARALGRDALAATATANAAFAHAMRGDDASARHLFGEALAAAGGFDSAEIEAHVLMLQAEAEFYAGNLEAALAAERAALRNCDDSSDMLLDRAVASANVAAFLIALDRFDEAQLHATEALALGIRLDHRLCAAWAMQHLAAIAALAPGRPAAGLAHVARTLGFVRETYVRLEAPMAPSDRGEYDRIAARLSAMLEPDRLERYLAEGAALTGEQAAAEAFAIEFV